MEIRFDSVETQIRRIFDRQREVRVIPLLDTVDSLCGQYRNTAESTANTM